jgi:hypothetical protein
LTFEVNRRLPPPCLHRKQHTTKYCQPFHSYLTRCPQKKGGAREHLRLKLTPAPPPRDPNAGGESRTGMFCRLHAIERSVRHVYNELMRTSAHPTLSCGSASRVGRFVSGPKPCYRSRNFFYLACDRLDWGRSVFVFLALDSRSRPLPRTIRDTCQRSFGVPLALTFLKTS